MSGKSFEERVKGRVQHNQYKAHWVYLVQCEKTPFVKFGFTMNPKSRLTTMQGGCPHKLSYVAKYKVSAKIYAEDLEKSCLDFLSHRIVRGEWLEIPTPCAFTALIIAAGCR